MALACMTTTCPHCSRVFSSTPGMFGQNALLLRDVHAPLCEDNPRNKCFCGSIFPNSAARDKHAVACEKNPANQFKCQHCLQEFLTAFGIMGRLAVDGKTLRDIHEVGCKDNPANTCFCGNVFPNPEARNAHAVTCDKNPANHYACQFCKAHFLKTFNMFGFCSNDGRAQRDSHQVCCEKNPKNICFCGGVFPNPSARDRHATTCSSNPVNRFQCSHCQRLFVTRFGVMGRVAYDGKGQRDSHEVGCEKNPANLCYCGQLFLNPTARDVHAIKCEMNPANRFSCQYCRKTFVTTFGMFSTNGFAERDAHILLCTRNPANATCEHCSRTFAEVKGPLKRVLAGPHRRCDKHSITCAKNPRNRFNCEHCNKCFVGGRFLSQMQDARLARDKHQKVCDYIPCTYEMREAYFENWLLMSEELEGIKATECTQSGLESQTSSNDGGYRPTFELFDSEDGIFVEEATSLICGDNSDNLVNSKGIPPITQLDDRQDFSDSASSCFDDAASSFGDPEEAAERDDAVDSAGTCFHEAESSNGDDNSDSGISSSSLGELARSSKSEASMG